MKSKLDLEDLITPAEAAKIRGVSKPAIINLIDRGRLAVHMVAGKRLLSRREVEAFVPLPVGRPPKARAEKRRRAA
jgi:excisionase family DNA binding protein